MANLVSYTRSLGFASQACIMLKQFEIISPLLLLEKGLMCSLGQPQNLLPQLSECLDYSRGLSQPLHSGSLGGTTLSQGSQRVIYIMIGSSSKITVIT